MAYSSDMMQYIIKVLNKKSPADTPFGERANFQEAICLHANVTWEKGQKALAQGALENTDTILIRTRYASQIDRNSLIEYEGITYQIQSLHSDRRANTTQIVATEMSGAARQEDETTTSTSPSKQDAAEE